MHHTVLPDERCARVYAPGGSPNHGPVRVVGEAVCAYACPHLTVPLLLEPAAVTVKRFPCRVGDSPRRSGVCPTTAWCGVRLTALKHPRCGHPHAPVVKCRGARTGRSLLLLEPAAVTVKRFPRRAEAGPAGPRPCGGGPPMCGRHMEMPPALVRSCTALKKKAITH